MRDPLYQCLSPVAFRSHRRDAFQGHVRRVQHVDVIPQYLTIENDRRVYRYIGVLGLVYSQTHGYNIQYTDQYHGICMVGVVCRLYLHIGV